MSDPNLVNSSYSERVQGLVQRLDEDYPGWWREDIKGLGSALNVMRRLDKLNPQWRDIIYQRRQAAKEKA